MGVGLMKASGKAYKRNAAEYQSGVVGVHWHKRMQCRFGIHSSSRCAVHRHPQRIQHAQQRVDNFREPHVARVGQVVRRLPAVR